MTDLFNKFIENLCLILISNKIIQYSFHLFCFFGILLPFVGFLSIFISPFMRNHILINNPLCMFKEFSPGYFAEKCMYPVNIKKLSCFVWAGRNVENTPQPSFL